MIQHIGIIGLLLIILILIVVFIICRCIVQRSIYSGGKIVQRSIYSGEKIAQKPICSGGGDDIVVNTQIIINNIVAQPIHVNIRNSGIPIIDALNNFNKDDSLQTSFIDAFKAYKTYVYDASMIEDFIDEIEPLPPPPPLPPPKTEEEKLLQFKEDFGYAVDITKFVGLRDKILNGIAPKIQKLSYLINTRHGITTNKIKLNYLNDADYIAHKAQYTLKSLITKYNSDYNKKLNKINNFKDKYYEFSKNYNIFEIFYDIYINIKNGYITNIDNLKNYFILQFNIIINLDLIDKIKEKKKDVLKHCCEKLGINSLEVFITVAAITKNNNQQFNNIKALEAIDDNQCWKLLQTLKNKYFTFTDTRTSKVAPLRQDEIKNMFYEFSDYINYVMAMNDITEEIDKPTPFNMLELIIVFLYIDREYIEIDTYINNNIKEPLINIDIQIVNDNYISTILNNFEFQYISERIKNILKYIEKICNKHPNYKLDAGTGNWNPIIIDFSQCDYPNSYFWNLYNKLDKLLKDRYRKKIPPTRPPNIDNYIKNTLNPEAKQIKTNLDKNYNSRTNPNQAGQLEFFNICIQEQHADIISILANNAEREANAVPDANTKDNITKLENLLSIINKCEQEILTIINRMQTEQNDARHNKFPSKRRQFTPQINSTYAKIQSSITNINNLSALIIPGYIRYITTKIANIRALPIYGGGPIANTIRNINTIVYTDITTELNRSRELSTPDEQLTSLKWAFNNINKNMDNDFKLLDSFFSEFITILRESNPSLIPNFEKPVWIKEEKKYNYFMPPVKDLIVPKKLKESIASIYSMITNESNKVSKTIEILQHIPIIKEKNKVYYNPLTPEEKKMIKKKLLKEDRDELDEEYDIDEIINGMKTNNLVYGRYTLYKDNMWKTIIIPIL